MLCIVFKVPPNIIGSQYEKLIIQKPNVTLDILATTTACKYFLTAYRIADNRIKRKSECRSGGQI